MDSRFQITESRKSGCVLRIDCFELAYEFSNFINKEIYVLSEIKRGEGHTAFCFGQASCTEKVEKVGERFLNR